jgi:hypothetical protein
LVDILEPLSEELTHAAQGEVVVLAIATPRAMLGEPMIATAASR